MEAYDFLHEWVKPIIKGDYQDFSSKKVEGYSLTDLLTRTMAVEEMT